ncbi:MAG: tRNA preQ1(34) S-adenosylmethionine ribosyltransferase-isomerase QueA, partial [Acidobacteriota bacterium]
MLTSEFDYRLPAELIAQKPLPQRDASRMLILRRREREIVHGRFQDLPQYLSAGDVLVLNNVRVIPAKAWGKKGAREVEFLFLKEMEAGKWEVLCRPAKRARVGDSISFAPDFVGEVVAAKASGKRLLCFPGRDVRAELKKIGYAPLPPYIKRRKDQTDLRIFDLERYQTVFAENEGAIAAPTAGLHFTPQILTKVKKKGVTVQSLTLEVGQATFEPVSAERVEAHRMLEERYTISPRAAQTISRAKTEDRPVVAVGTTVVRALESAGAAGRVRPGTCSTSLFIFPGYEFKVVDKLLTNFHLPKSSLLMLVSAFAGIDLIRKAYAEAVRL